MDQRRQVTDEERQREAVPHDQQENRDHYVSDRGREQRLLLLEPQDHESSHAAASCGCLVKSRNIRSRSGGSGVSSQSARPCPISAAASSWASCGRASASTRYVTGPADPAFSLAIERTPGTAPMQSRTACSVPATCSRRRCPRPPCVMASAVNSRPSSRIITRLAICSIS